MTTAEHIADEEREAGHRYTWMRAEVECAVCEHAETSVFPSVAPALECEACGHMNPVPWDAVVYREA